MIPFAILVMSHKSEKAYKGGFKFLDEHVMTLQCESFMTDYERAMRNGLASVSPKAKLTSCWFHFCQACKRQASKLPDLINEIHTNEAAEKAYYELLTLPLLPAKEIRKAFETIKLRLLTLGTPHFDVFLAYYEKQWLIRVSNFSIVIVI